MIHLEMFQLHWRNGNDTLYYGTIFFGVINYTPGAQEALQMCVEALHRYMEE